MNKVGLHILGATGSIGKSTLEVYAHLNKIGFDKFSLDSVSAKQSKEALQEIVSLYKPRSVALIKSDNVNFDCMNYYSGENAVKDLVEGEVVSGDFVVNALVGASGLRPTLAALELGATVALANKETLVSAGSLVMNKVLSSSGNIIPIDSEHASAFRVLEQGSHGTVSKLILTASGGPFNGRPPCEVGNVSVEEVLRHPTWKMGPKITVDSATMMNKAFEIIEAYWLFNLPMSKIEVVIHPESMLHAMVEYEDGFIFGVLSEPDMRIPIQQSLTWPKSLPSLSKNFNWDSRRRLDWNFLNSSSHPAIKLAHHVLREGGTSGAILNASNEIAVRAYLEGALEYSYIIEISEIALDRVVSVEANFLEDIESAHSEAEKCAIDVIKSKGKNKVIFS